MVFVVDGQILIVIILGTKVVNYNYNIGDEDIFLEVKNNRLYVYYFNILLHKIIFITYIQEIQII